MNALKDSWAWLLLLAVVVFGVFAYAQMRGEDNVAGNAEKELVDVDAEKDMMDDSATSTDETASSSEEEMMDKDEEEMEDKEEMMDDEMMDKDATSTEEEA